MKLETAVAVVTKPNVVQVTMRQPEQAAVASVERTNTPQPERVAVVAVLVDLEVDIIQWLVQVLVQNVKPVNTGTEAGVGRVERTRLQWQDLQG